MAAADKQLEISQQLLASEIDKKLEETLSEELSQQFTEQANNVSDFNKAALPRKSGNTASQAQSGRVLELQRKQQSNADNRSEMENCANLMKMLILRSGQMSEYLEKAETEIIELENIENKYLTLRNASEKLTGEFRSLSAKYSETQKRVSLLEEQQNVDREKQQVA
ncbi:MAG: hypothetical protein AAGA76_13570, partial [Pseudomonadota bacterium]